MTSDLKNPMRFGLHIRTVDLDGFDVTFTELEIRPSEGNVYLHWEADDDG